MIDRSIPATTRKGEAFVEVESLSRPGHVHLVNAETGECPCPATIKRCRHYRIMRVRTTKATLAEMKAEMFRARDELRAAGHRPPKRLIDAFADARDVYQDTLKAARGEAVRAA